MGKEIPLGRSGKVAVVDDEDFEAVARFRWFYAQGYAKRKVAGRNLAMSRHLLGIPNGTGHSVVVDHANGDRLDNRRSNLRVCTQGQNVTNSHKRRTHRAKNPTSHFKGVARNGPFRWRSRIVVDGRTVFLGNFSSEEAAAEAYRLAALEYFGDYARS